MGYYEHKTKEELLEIVEKLEEKVERLSSELDSLRKGRFRERYSTRILDALPDMLTVFDHNANIVELASSPTTNHVEGTTADSIINSNVKDIVPEEAYESVRQNMDKVIRTGKSSIAEHSLTLDGVLHHYENRIFPLDDQYLLCMCRDVSQETEMARTNEVQRSEIVRLNSLMNDILNNIPVYLFVKDTGNDFRYLYWNKAFAEYSGISVERAVGRTDAEIFPDKKDAERLRQDDLKAMELGRIEYLETYTTMSGEVRTVTTMKTVVPSGGRYPYIIGVSWDVTETKKTEKELIAARIKAEEADRMKSSFLANMSHEIRTPLNAIIGFSNILAAAEEEQEKQEYINIIESNNTLLLQLISDILDLSKIEAGTLEFSYCNIELNDIISEIESVTRYRTESNGIQLIVQKGLPSCLIRTEKNRLMQVLNNLLNNASKFTSQGSITFGYKLCDKELYFYVKDTGCGIPADKVNSIFGRFVKLNSFVQGTGLGLSICQTIVEHMGGRIGVESEEGKGSTFWFTIPYQPAAAENKKEEEHQLISVQKDKLTILIAEDNESNYRLFQSILKREYNLVHAWDGKEAVNLYKLHTPQIILMDINMPVMDGYEATREIRKLSLDVPIIAVTAFAYASDEQRAMENGFDGYMAKPISAPQLRQQIAAILQKRIILL